MNGGAKYRKWGGLGRLGGTQGHGQCHHSIERIRLGVTPVEFHGDLWLQKTKVPGLSCGVVYVILRLAV